MSVPDTVISLLLARFAERPGATAWLSPDTPPVWRAHTWREIDAEVRRRAAALQRSGVRPGDRVALLGPTSVSWAMHAFAVLWAGAALVPLHTSSTTDELRWILQDAGVTLLIADRSDLGVRTTSFTAPAPDATSPPAHRAPADLAVMVYTSGTTGHPKGVMLTHDNLVAVTLGAERLIERFDDDLAYHFLPFSHVYGLVNLLVATWVGAPMAIDGRLDRIAEGLREVRPTYFAGVPRVFEKIAAMGRERAARRSPRAAQIWDWAVRTAVAWSDHTTQERRLPKRLRLAHALADRLVYQRLRDGLGGRLRATSSGGAPLSRDLAAFFHGAGLLVLEGYGMTELCSIVSANRPDAWRLGSVGLPGEGLEVRVATDGEVCVRGRTVMAGYWGQTDATAETIREGWLHTGDIGHIDVDGFLFITDRKKNLLVTAGGKNIAPAPIEARLKALCPALSEVVLLGDRRPCCIALVTLQEGETTDTIDAAVARLNDELPSWSTIKAWRALPAELTVESGELTPSLKVRRRVVEARYEDLITSAYAALARRDIR